MFRSFFAGFLLLGLEFVGFSAARASDLSLSEYYIGRDTRATIPSGTYAGLPNPNYNRLTFLYAHTYPDTPVSNHYHAKSPYTYFGPNAGVATTVQSYNGNSVGVPSNYVPESGDPIKLLPGAGAFSGKYISGLTPNEEATRLTMNSVDSLASYGAGTGGHTLYHSGGTTPVDRFAGSMAGSNLTLEVTSISPGLTVADQLGNTILDSIGDQYVLGNGGASLDFTPVFQTENIGSYSVTFKLIDNGTGNAGGPWLESGQFTFNTQAVPEPSTIILGSVLGLVSIYRWRRKRLSAV